ncbi:hypothetical protein [Streptomyces sp. NPDC059893]|uniref:hypothetical protein n=1 Tax=Streptomyces sp. NPDC059893 TaxID=3346990 RepID=UPI00364A4B82
MTAELVVVGSVVVAVVAYRSEASKSSAWPMSELSRSSRTLPRIPLEEARE